MESWSISIIQDNGKWYDLFRIENNKCWSYGGNMFVKQLYNTNKIWNCHVRNVLIIMDNNQILSPRLLCMWLWFPSFFYLSFFGWVCLFYFKLEWEKDQCQPAIYEILSGFPIFYLFIFWFYQFSCAWVKWRNCAIHIEYQWRRKKGSYVIL